jgi:voltage-gated potassium channel
VRNLILPNRFLVLLAVPLGLVVAGTLGYCVIEGWHWFDGLYMTVITLSTIGYGETHPLSVRGRAFTMVLIFGGVFTVLYAGTEVIRGIISGEIRQVLGKQRMERQLAELHQHLIVCGFGRMGRLVCAEFSNLGDRFVVIDRHEEALEDFTMPHGIPLHGDATSDDVLRHAGIERARALVTVVASDADNLYTTMSARLLNDKLFIVARAEDAHSEQKLLRAGANRVVSPYRIGGSRVAQAVLRPTVMDFLELATQTEHVELQIEETRITTYSPLVGSTLQDSRLRKDLGIIIVAIKKTSGKMLFNPAPETTLEVGDILIAMGDRQHLDRLDALAKR